MLYKSLLHRYLLTFAETESHLASVFNAVSFGLVIRIQPGSDYFKGIAGSEKTAFRLSCQEARTRILFSAQNRHITSLSLSLSGHFLESKYRSTTCSPPICPEVDSDLVLC